MLGFEGQFCELRFEIAPRSACRANTSLAKKVATYENVLSLNVGRMPEEDVAIMLRI